MKQLVIAAALCASVTPPLATPAQAASGTVERACLKADRDKASPALCGCIQDVASAVFSSSEERQVAKLFSSPEKTQELRQSDRASDEAFWQKYKYFGEVATLYCSS